MSGFKARQHGIKKFPGVFLPDLKTFDVFSDQLETFDMDAFVELNRVVNVDNGIVFVMGGENFVGVNVESRVSMMNVIYIRFYSVSSEGEFDVSKMLSKFPKCKNFDMAGSLTQNGYVGSNLATLKFSYPFYENLELFGLVGFGDISGFLNLPKEYTTGVKMETLKVSFFEVFEPFSLTFDYL